MVKKFLNTSFFQRIKYLKRPKKIGHLITSFLKGKFYGLPNELLVEISSLCNINCTLCSVPSKHLTRNKKMMSFKDFKRIVDDVSSYIYKISLIVGGEPFMNKEIFKMIRYANKKNLFITVSSNATLLNRKIIDNILSSGLDTLVVNIGGATTYSHESYMKGSSFLRVKENIKMLCKEKEKRNLSFPIIKLQTLITSYNEDEIDRVKKLADEMNVDKFVCKSLGIVMEYFKDGSVFRLAKKILPKKHEEFSRYKLTKKSLIHKINCNCIFLNKTGILSNGKIICCCYDINGIHDLGNVFEEPLQKIWKSEKYKKIRKKMRNKELPFCKYSCNPFKISIKSG